MGENQTGPFLLSFNASLKIGFRGTRGASARLLYWYVSALALSPQKEELIILDIAE